MPQPTDSQHRRSIRLRGYDYAADGAYFVTLCTHEKTCHFGEVVDGEMQLNETGMLVRNAWLRTAEVRPQVVLDAFVVMPNHLHGIIMIDHPVGAHCMRPSATDQGACNAPLRRASNSLGAIIAGFKATVTRQVHALTGENGPLWQRNYFEHIIRNEADLEAIREYIVANPARWAEDEYR